MKDTNDYIDKVINELKELQKSEELKIIEKKRLENEEIVEHGHRLEMIRKNEEVANEKAILANDLLMENLFEGKNNEINNEDIKRYNRLNPPEYKTKKRLSSEGKKKIYEDKEARKIEQKKIDSLNGILSRRDKFSTLLKYDDNMQWMITKRLFEVIEIVDYSGRVIAVGKRIEFGVGGFFYVFDNRDKSFTLYLYDIENKELKKIVSSNSEEELIAVIEDVDPGRRLGFKYRYYPPQTKSIVVEKSKEAILEEKERKHIEEMEKFDKLFGTEEESNQKKSQDSIDDEFDK